MGFFCFNPWYSVKDVMAMTAVLCYYLLLLFLGLNFSLVTGSYYIKYLAMASTSCAKQSPLPMKEPPSTYYSYPFPRYEDIVASPKLFMSTLEKLHATMGTKFI
ncbi:hypothetical protein Patl1_25993 [Pistacia atlantica]|uniref:Uncharacterized protein n=1 Tax=Pistacia atlantica TaxID=434234 RepID=A0ACC1B5A4_9ROSI|nr:hypothetical protein Patl1_25993 [Pistacia atlantica]